MLIIVNIIKMIFKKILARIYVTTHAANRAAKFFVRNNQFQDVKIDYTRSQILTISN
jgi:hypothetical protein